MLNLVFKPHRDNLKANVTDVQKVFAMLKVIPQSNVAQARPPLAFALVIDTSGSMRDASAGGTKLDQAIAAGHELVDDDRLAPEDQIAIIHFDDEARTLLPLGPLWNKSAAHSALESLRHFNGRTYMARGLRLAGQEFQYLAPQVAKRVLLLTDGQTFDEEECAPLARRFGGANTPIIAMGIGAEYNENLLRDLAQSSQGRPYHLQDMTQLHEVLEMEVQSSVREVVTDLQATVATVKGVTLDSLTRVYPSLAEVDLAGQPYRLGNIAAGDYTVFTLEFTIEGIARPASRARLAQMGLTGYAPGLNTLNDMPLQNLFVTFTGDDTAVASVDAEVLGYVQQKNVDRMVQNAVQQAGSNAAQARQTLQTAINMTQRIGNTNMTQMLANALEELEETGTISPGTRKTVSLGGRTQTIKTGSAPLEGVPSEEEIRKLTGA